MPRSPASPARLAAATLLLAVAACHAPRPATPPPLDPARVHALLLSGGGRPPTNYYSHLRHLIGMRDLLAGAGIPPDQTVVLSSDGDDPAADLATRETPVGGDFWLLEGTRLEPLLKPPITMVSSAIPGTPLRSATMAELTAWADDLASRTHPGDTVFVFVTDHGTRNRQDPTDNRITLWGGESVSVRALRTLLDRLDPGVRVVTVMSQCFSGSFANLASVDPTTGPRAVCGYFSTTAKRLAYGCYPENRNRDDVGYGFRMIRALGASGDLDAAHRTVLVSDDSPDVPIRTSDVYLSGVVRAAAKAAGRPLVDFADEQLAAALADKARWEPDLRLLDAIGQRYGIFGPRRLAEVAQQLDTVPPLADELRTHRHNWQRSCAGAADANVSRFLHRHPAWADRLQPAQVKDLAPDARRALTLALLDDLERSTRADAAADARLDLLHHRRDTAAALSYRMDTRVGVLLRMRFLLMRIAGTHWIETRGTDVERRHLATLLDCEQLRLPVAPGSVPSVEANAPFPGFADDLAATQSIVPGWMGVQFKPATEAVREETGVGVGAAKVQAVYPDSPAKAAGLQVGDLVVGPPGGHFQEPEQLREWVMTAALEEPAPLDIVRDGRRERVTLVPKPYPRVWPKLPGPPAPGTSAPALGLTPYRGTPPTSLARGRPTLLFFWATWCGVCKAALPELEAVRKANALDVVAITDEEPGTLDAFFKAFGGEFPPVVAIDENRQAFLGYGVSGMPTFVLIDGAGRVQAIETGYTKDEIRALVAGS